MKNTKKSLRRITATLVAMAASASFAATPISGAGITFSMPSFSASAADTDVLTYKDFSYKVTENGIVITAYNGSDAKPVIPSAIDETAVTAIGNSAFYKCTTLTEIEIPASVTNIGINAFKDCTSLEKLTLNEGLTTLSQECFANTKITSVTIPSTLSSVNMDLEYYYGGPFGGCKLLEDITIDEKATKIPDCLFKNCSSLATIDIPYFVRNIGKSAFENCTSLKDVTIHNPYCDINNKNNTISNSATIHSYTPSTAKNYAQSFEREFVSLGSFTLGDVNEDGSINSSDASKVLEEYALIQTGAEPTFTEIQKISADVNTDYTIDSSDASKILAYYADSSTGKTPSWD